MGDTCTIGIDLGTSNSCVATCTPAGHEIIRNRLGGRTTPSVVSAGKGGDIVVGDAANRQAIMNPERTIFGVKRLVGRKYASPEVVSLRETLPYPVIEAPNRDAWVRLLERSMSPSEVQSYILDELRTAAEDYLDTDVGRAIITVPAFFDEAQRQATRDAGTIAGFGNVRVLAEPTAAALAHGIGGNSDKLVAVFDMGGGTLDVSIMHVQGGRYDVLATSGDMLLGGADFDRALAASFAAEIERDHGVAILDNKVALQRLVTEAEGAKKALSGLDSVTISLPYLAQGPAGQIDYERKVTRDELNTLVAPLIERMLAPCRVALADASVTADRIDEVLLVGGMTRSLVVQDAVTRFFDRKPSQKINPDEAVAIGAALLAGMVDGRLQGAELIDVAPHSIGMRVAGDRMSPLIKRAAKLPAVAKKAFATTEDNQRSVEIQLYQGEDPVASKNTRLSTVSLSGIEPAPRGKVRIGVEFHASEDGKMAIKARQLGGSGAPMDVDIVVQTGLGRAVVERLAQERAAQRKPREVKASKPSEAAQQSGFGIQFARPASAPPRAASAPPVAAPAGRSESSSGRAASASARAQAAGSGKSARVGSARGSERRASARANTAADARAAILGDDEPSSKSQPAQTPPAAPAARPPAPNPSQPVFPPAEPATPAAAPAAPKPAPATASPAASPPPSAAGGTATSATGGGSKTPWIAVAVLVTGAIAALIAVLL